MRFYIPLGPLGFILRVGTIITGILGCWVYWRDSRRRDLIPAPLPVVEGQLEG